jgi:hypothetical protein
MIDDQVDTEELAESRRQREAASKATNDGAPAAPENEKPIIAGTQDGPPKLWVRYTKKWFGTGIGFMHP